MKSTDLRTVLKKHGIKQWQLAQAIGVHRTTLTEWTRSELTQERQQRIEAALNKLTGGYTK